MIGGSPPASRSKTFQFVISLRRAATIASADPAPTTIKSYEPKPANQILFVSVIEISDLFLFKCAN